MLRDRLATLLVAVALSTGVGYVVGHDGGSSADAASGNSAVVTQLKKLNKSIGKSATDRGTVRGLLGLICVNQTGSASQCAQ